jgi:hypothetical protein
MTTGRNTEMVPGAPGLVFETRESKYPYPTFRSFRSAASLSARNTFSSD